jgi:hypothetical protein
LFSFISHYDAFLFGVDLFLFSIFKSVERYAIEAAPGITQKKQ